MENLDNIGKNSLEALSRDNLTEKGKKKIKARDNKWCNCFDMFVFRTFG